MKKYIGENVPVYEKFMLEFHELLNKYEGRVTGNFIAQELIEEAKIQICYEQEEASVVTVLGTLNFMLSNEFLDKLFYWRRIIQKIRDGNELLSIKKLREKINE